MWRSSCGMCTTDIRADAMEQVLFPNSLSRNTHMRGTPSQQIKLSDPFHDNRRPSHTARVQRQPVEF